jgi:hypothetical protein
LAKHLATLLAAKEAADPKHAELCAAAKSALAVEKPVSVKTEVALVQSKVSAALALQEGLGAKCASLKVRIGKHMELLDKFMEDLASKEELLSEAKEQYAAAISDQAKVLEASKTDGPVLGKSDLDGAPPGFHVGNCTSIEDLAKLFGSLPDEHKKLLASSLAVNPTALPRKHKHRQDDSSVSSLAPDQVDAGGDAPMAGPKDNVAESKPSLPKRAKVDGTGAVEVLDGSTAAAAAADATDVATEPLSAPAEPALVSSTPRAGSHNGSTSAADFSGAGKCEWPTLERPTPYSSSLELSSKEEIRAKCKEYSNSVEKALGRTGF